MHTLATMFPSHIFPNFSIPPPDLPEFENVDTKIHQFLLQHGLGMSQNVSESSKNSPNMRLCDIQKRFNTVTKLKNDLECLSEELKSNINQISEEKWQQNVREIENIQKKLDIEVNYLHKNGTSIQKLIKKRQNKRKINKKRKIMKRDIQKSIMTHRQMKNEDIDRNLQQIQIKMVSDQQVTIEKDETQKTLASVNKRIREAREKLELFESLIKLRYVRKQQSQRAENDFNEENFVEEINRMKTLWNMALEQHLEEEQKLQEYLENKFRPQKTIEQQWNEVLFGPSSLTNKKIDHPLLRAEKSLDAFLAIRHEWDSCIDAEGTTIPFFWVLPRSQKQAGDNWQLYQKKTIIPY